MSMSPKQINTLVQAVEHDVREMIPKYVELRLNEDLDVIKNQMAELFETMIAMADRLTALEGATHGEARDKHVPGNQES